MFIELVMAAMTLTMTHSPLKKNEALQTNKNFLIFFRQQTFFFHFNTFQTSFAENMRKENKKKSEEFTTSCHSNQITINQSKVKIQQQFFCFFFLVYFSFVCTRIVHKSIALNVNW